MNMPEPIRNRHAFLIAEYEKLKDEQQKRIEFRDQMIYLTLGAIGAVFSFALGSPNSNLALLVLPFVCVIMGWTYLSNDSKISLIGIYLRNTLIPQIIEVDLTQSEFISWETFSRTISGRRVRKRIQLCIDLLLFVLSGVVSIISFIVLKNDLWITYLVPCLIEAAALGMLTFNFIKHADL